MLPEGRPNMELLFDLPLGKIEIKLKDRVFILNIA